MIWFNLFGGAEERRNPIVKSSITAKEVIAEEDRQRDLSV